MLFGIRGFVRPNPDAMNSLCNQNVLNSFWAPEDHFRVVTCVQAYVRLRSVPFRYFRELTAFLRGCTKTEAI